MANAALDMMALRAHTILTPAMEEDLAAHIKTLADQFHGLSAEKCRWLCYEFAVQNEVLMPDNWKRQQRAGKDWFAGFKRRQNWSCRKPETTSIARVTAFNRNAVTKFFENLEAVGERHTFAHIQSRRNWCLNCSDTKACVSKK